MFVKIFFRGMVITLSFGCVVARYIRKMLELIKNFGCNNLCNNSFFFFSRHLHGTYLCIFGQILH